MRNLQLKTNVEPQSLDYPFGRIRDKNGSTPGTPVNEELYGDIHQFFARVFDASSLTYNNLPESQYNGFQMYDALLEVILLKMQDQRAATWTPLSLVNNWVNEGSSQYHDAAYYLDPFGFVHLRGTIKRNNAADGDGVVIATLPAGARPTKKVGMVSYASSLVGYAGREAIAVTVDVSGLITPLSMKSKNVLLLLNQANDFLTLDGLCFKM